MILIALIVAIFSFIPIIAVLLSVAVGLAVTVGALWLFFLASSRLAYVPQVMLVESRGVFAAIGRSASLASGSVRRLAALFIFTFVATYSALALLYVPLLFYASANGIDVMDVFDPDLIPAWYQITSTLIGQFSFILLSPVVMIGLCLLHVYDRVRSEGYDIELMAAARLGDIPDVLESYLNPLHSALANAATAAVASQNRSQMTTLGLK